MWSFNHASLQMLWQNLHERRNAHTNLASEELHGTLLGLLDEAGETVGISILQHIDLHTTVSRC